MNNEKSGGHFGTSGQQGYAHFGLPDLSLSSMLNQQRHEAARPAQTAKGDLPKARAYVTLPDLKSEPDAPNYLGNELQGTYRNVNILPKGIDPLEDESGEDKDSEDGDILGNRHTGFELRAPPKIPEVGSNIILQPTTQNKFVEDFKVLANACGGEFKIINQSWKFVPTVFRPDGSSNGLNPRQAAAAKFFANVTLATTDLSHASLVDNLPNGGEMLYEAKDKSSESYLTVWLRRLTPITEKKCSMVAHVQYQPSRGRRFKSSVVTFEFSSLVSQAPPQVTFYKPRVAWYDPTSRTLVTGADGTLGVSQGPANVSTTVHFTETRPEQFCGMLSGIAIGSKYLCNLEENGIADHGLVSDFYVYLEVAHSGILELEVSTQAMLAGGKASLWPFASTVSATFELDPENWRRDEGEEGEGRKKGKARKKHKASQPIGDLEFYNTVMAQWATHGPPYTVNKS